MMKYTIYKITNIINGMFYIGKHQTLNINDNYFGSGFYLRRAIKKYGKENFKKEILFIFDNEDQMNKKERELVNEKLINDPLCYNMMLGGEGGDTWSRLGRKHSEETKKKISQKVQQYLQNAGEEGHLRRSNAAKIFNAKIKSDPIRFAQIQKKRSETMRKKKIKRSCKSFQSETSRKKISESLKAHYDKIGRKTPIKNPMPYKSINAQGKKVKVYLNDEEHTVYECDLQWYLNNGWIKGRNPNNKKPHAYTEDAKNNSSGKGKFVVNNPNTSEVKRINPSELLTYLNNGWKRGYRK